MTERDPFDILRENNPFDPSDAPDGESAEALALLARITATDPRKPLARPLRSRLALGFFSVLLIAAISIVWMRATDVQGVVCFDSPNVEGTRVGVRPNADLDTSNCEPLWSDGVLVNPAVAEPGSVPPLIGCVTEDGALWVFPSDDPATCEDLGLARLESGQPEDAILVFQARLADLFTDNECLEMEGAEQAVEGHLTELGLDTWTVVAQPATEDRPCASFSLDVEAEVVILVPIIMFDD